MSVYWSEENQEFYTTPDGDKATHKQIKEYYEHKMKGGKGPFIYKSSLSGQYEIRW